MKTPFLLPNHFRKLGWFLFVPGLLLAILIPALSLDTEKYLNVTVFALYDSGIMQEPKAFTWIQNSIVDELLLVLLIVGGILIGFSRLKDEDELIGKIRYESLVWATYLNYAVILFLTIFIFGFWYYNVLLYNTFTLILFFIVRFHYKLYQLQKAAKDDQ